MTDPWTTKSEVPERIDPPDAYFADAEPEERQYRAGDTEADMREADKLRE